MYCKRKSPLHEITFDPAKYKISIKYVVMYIKKRRVAKVEAEIGEVGGEQLVEFALNIVHVLLDLNPAQRTRTLAQAGRHQQRENVGNKVW